MISNYATINSTASVSDGSILFRKGLRSSVFLILLCLSQVVPAETVIVTRNDSEFDSVSTTELQQLWLKQVLYLNGAEVELRDLPESNPVRVEFYNKVIEKSGNSLAAYWAKLVFRGLGFPPNILYSESEIYQWVIGGKNRISYLDSEHVDGHIKVLYTTGANKF